MAQHGRLLGPAPRGQRSRKLEADGRDYVVGDQVIARWNDRRHGLVNGMRGTIEELALEAGAVAFRPLDGGDLVRVPREYPADGHLHHGYALTAHLAQGMTVDRAYVLGSESPERGWTYSALTRHREGVRMYVAAPATLKPEISGQQDPSLSSRDLLGRDGTKSLALDTMPDGSRAEGLDELRHRARELRRLLDKISDAEHELDHARTSLANAENDPSALGDFNRRSWTAEVTKLEANPLLDVDKPAISAEHTSARATFEGRLRFELERAATIALVRPPSHVVELIGKRPADLRNAATWDRTVWRIERYRLTHLDQRDRADHRLDLGPAPLDPAARSEWATTMASVRAFHPEREVSQGIEL